MIMKKRVISIVGLVIIVILISYGLTIFEIKSKIIWGLLFVALTYLICAMTNKFLKPNTILYALLTGIVVTHIPWWISLHINYNINFDSLIRNFFEGTKMSYSIEGQYRDTCCINSQSYFDKNSISPD